MKKTVIELVLRKQFITFIRAIVFSGVLILPCMFISSCSNSLMGPSTVDQEDPEDPEGEDPNDPGGGTD